MSSTFSDLSKTIADNFLQSIVFIDDNAFIAKQALSHPFNAEEITRAFASKQKVCAVYRPKSSQDMDHLTSLAKKADVTVLDWHIVMESANNEEINSEEDAEEIDPRGTETCKVIRGILSDPITGAGSLKLILIYTAETNLPDIAEKIYEDLKKVGVENLEFNDCKVFTENIRILVLAKQAGPEQFKHNPELKSKIIRYEQLPDFVLEQFTQITSGLLTNFALACLTTIRNSSFQLLSLFGKKLDAAYLGHRALLPSNRDAEDQLVELMKDSIGDLLHYRNVTKCVEEDVLKNWLNEKFSTKVKAYLNEKGKPFKDAQGNDITATYEVDSKLALSLIACDEQEISKRFKEAFKNRNIEALKTKENKEAFLRLAQLNSTEIFTDEDDDFQELDRRLAKLSHHRNLFSPVSYQPKLWQGTVIKGIESNKYWICIQQKCDSVRLKPGIERRFLFLPLIAIPNGTTDRFHFVTPDNVKLRLIIKSYELRTIKFIDVGGSGLIMAEKQGERFLFHPTYSNQEAPMYKQESFEWIFDLKDLHSQRVANDFAREISRVGLDESEWLRRSAGF